MHRAADQDGAERPSLMQPIFLSPILQGHHDSIDADYLPDGFVLQ